MFRWRTDVDKFIGVNWKFALQLLTLLSVFWQATAHHCLFESEISITDHCNTTQLAPGVLQQDCQNVPSLGNLFFFFRFWLHCVHVFTGACVCMFVCGGCVCVYCCEITPLLPCSSQVLVIARHRAPCKVTLLFRILEVCVEAWKFHHFGNVWRDVRLLVPLWPTHEELHWSK